ncbi:DCC1-like thiol-disulfide oxidoreductase family protein [Halopiger djelfimassiliensis]|uniref:DCC1-like thiol-disulfide oxidoreductase family protein n=1 Tax=Halopiger djelfimassiliensis TaxID=1293047 RepID=UPI0006779ED3|nr:DCC1-like thiol-disulfide oxidoreductase family protein [Halopiger djelfimassiliensis]
MEPTFVYDDDCGFCTWWADFFADRTSLRIVGFSELSPELRERLPEYYEECSHLVTDRRVYSCGASIEQALARSDIGGSVDDMLRFLRNFEDYERFRERGYRWVADNRDLWGRVLSKTPPVRRDSSDRR